MHWLCTRKLGELWRPHTTTKKNLPARPRNLVANLIINLVNLTVNLVVNLIVNLVVNLVVNFIVNLILEKGETYTGPLGQVFQTA